ncbi:MAG: rhomboid family intramembrane serine protease [Alphaproteobacteria bacterium]
MIPLHDDNPTSLRPLVTIALIVACTLVFLWQVALPAQEAQIAIYAFGMIPAVLFGDAELPPRLAKIPTTLSLVTSMFLHGGWLHLIGNMLYLWIFGNNIEDSMGHRRFIVFYILCGIAAALTQAVQDPASVVPMIGASGAIGGILGGYIVLFPRARILVLVPLGILFFTLRIPAVVVLGIWFALQFFLSTMSSTGAPGGVATWAHVGGFVAGLILIAPFRDKQFPLFGGHRRTGKASGPRPARRRNMRGPWG